VDVGELRLFARTLKPSPEWFSNLADPFMSRTGQRRITMTLLSSQAHNAHSPGYWPCRALSGSPGQLPRPALGDHCGRPVEVDRVQMKAALKTSQTALYTVHEMQTSVRHPPCGSSFSPAGVCVRSDLAGDPSMPDLRPGPGLRTSPIYQTAPAPPAASGIRPPGRWNDRTSSFHSGGHLRSFFGFGFTFPRLVPAESQPNQLK